MMLLEVLLRVMESLEQGIRGEPTTQIVDKDRKRKRKAWEWTYNTFTNAHEQFWRGTLLFLKYEALKLQRGVKQVWSGCGQSIEIPNWNHSVILLPATSFAAMWIWKRRTFLLKNYMRFQLSTSPKNAVDVLKRDMKSAILVYKVLIKGVVEVLEQSSKGVPLQGQSKSSDTSSIICSIVYIPRFELHLLCLQDMIHFVRWIWQLWIWEHIALVLLCTVV